MLSSGLEARFTRLYGAVPRVVQAPGRVNLIGEHTDYNDGFVMPMAIELSTRIAFAPRADGRLVVRSESLRDEVEIDLSGNRDRAIASNWSDYPRAVALTLRDAGIPIPGATLLVESDVPVGAGLSSSASFEVATALALLSLAEQEMAPADVALLCHRAENEVVGTRCGIMDQFISCLAREEHAMLLDCRSREPRFFPLPSDVRVVVVNSGVHHALASGEYNRRRAECERAVEILEREMREIREVRALRDVSEADLAEHRAALGELLHRRARHVVTENARVLAFADALERSALEDLGDLMSRSHASLRDDYEVSCAEIDALVEIARGEPGVLGSRMTGGGFGGCTVQLIHAQSVEPFRHAVRERYARATGRSAEVHVTRAVGAAR